MQPAPPSRCRVLELGCGDGGNLLPMAFTLPGSEFVGVDLSPSAIARGRETADALGIANAELREGDLAALPDDLGTFDYVLSHGVYSWVPPAAREGLMAACGELLAPNGVAYISYNAYPGSHLRDMAKGMLKWHVEGIESPAERIAAARELMEIIVAVESQSAYAKVLREHAERVLAYGDALLFHDDLAEVSTAFYFHEFMAHAAQHGLRFLAEADLSAGRIGDVPMEAARRLEELGGPDVVLREQYMDFVRNRMFRQTLLCRTAVDVQHALSPGDVAGFYIASAAEPEGEVVVEGKAPGTFRTPTSTITSDAPIVKAAMNVLGETWPGAVAFDDLLAAARERAGSGGDVDVVIFGDAMLRAHLAEVVELRTEPPPLCTRPCDRPRVNAFARFQAARGDAVVTTLRHTSLSIVDPLGRRLIALMDGTRDRAALAEAMRAPSEDPDWAPPPDEELPEAIDDAIDRLAKAGLFDR